MEFTLKTMVAIIILIVTLLVISTVILDWHEMLMNWLNMAFAMFNEFLGL